MDAGLTLMAKDGQALEVHPSCVAAHERAGWRIAPPSAPAAEPPAPPAPKGKRPAKPVTPTT